MKRRLFAVTALLLMVASCISAPEPQIASVTTETPTVKPTSTVTSAPAPTSAPTPTSTPTATPTVIPTLSVEGLEGMTQPQSESILEGVVSFTPKLHSKYTEDDFVIGFDKDNHPLVIAIYNADTKEWEWKREVGLRDLTRQAGVRIGIDFQKELMNNSKYMDTIKRNFDEVILAQGLYWRWYEPKQGELDPYNMSDIKQQLAVFKQLTNDTVVRGQHLIFAENNPDWLASGNFSRDESIAVLRDHVASVATRFKGVVEAWVVVNEPYFQTIQAACGFDYIRHDFFYEKIGPEYIEIAFQAARDADSSAILIYNDTANHASPSCDQNGLYTKLTLKNTAMLKAKGLIDGVGMQMHIDAANPPKKDDVIRTMQGYGLPIYITELDVDLSNVRGTQEDRFAKQAGIYADIASACLESGVCHNLSFWDMGDKNSWLEVYLNKPNADATIFDDRLDPKPAYYALFDVFVQAVTVTVTSGTP